MENGGETTFERLDRRRRAAARRRGGGWPEATGCVGCLGRAILLGWGVFLVLWLVPPMLVEWYTMVQPYMKKVAPGMTEAEVRALFPRRMQVEVRETSRPMASAWMVAEDAPVARELTVRRPDVPDILFLWDALADIDSGIVYFNPDGVVVGLGYTAYGNHWEPKWGARYPRPCDCPETEQEPESAAEVEP